MLRIHKNGRIPKKSGQEIKLNCNGQEILKSIDCIMFILYQ